MPLKGAEGQNSDDVLSEIGNMVDRQANSFNLPHNQIFLKTFGGMLFHHVSAASSIIPR